MEESLELYTCKQGPASSEFPGAVGPNITTPRSYNELATLMSVPGWPPRPNLPSPWSHLLLSLRGVTAPRRLQTQY